MSDNILNELEAPEGSIFYDAVFGFASYLTSLREIIEVGSNADASIMAELAAKFCESNGHLHPTPDFPQNLIYPQET